MLGRWRGGPRNYPHNGDDFDVIGPDEKIIGRVMKPGGRAEHWFWALKMVVRQQPRGSGTAPTREEGQRRSVRTGLALTAAVKGRRQWGSWQDSNRDLPVRSRALSSLSVR